MTRRMESWGSNCAFSSEVAAVTTSASHVRVGDVSGPGMGVCIATATPFGARCSISSKEGSPCDDQYDQDQFDQDQFGVSHK